MNGLSVIIPSKIVTNLTPCIRAINEHEPGVRIIWVDDRDGWGDADRAPFAIAGDRLSVIQGVKPFIFARNVNLGIQAAGSDDVVVLNDDALLRTPSGFNILQKSAQDHPEFGIIGSTTNVTGQPLQQPRGIGLREIPHFAFVCVFIPRSTIQNDKIGLLDERYNLDYGVEDLDYCEMVTRSGLKVGVHDGCFVDHSSLFSSFRGDPRAPKDFAQNYRLFQKKFGIA